MSDEVIKPEDNPAVINGVFHTSLEPQSDPVVGHMEQAPQSETIGVDQLKAKEVEAAAYLSTKVAELETYLDGLLTELNQREEKVIADGRSVFDNIAGHANRLLARLKE